MDRKDQLTVSDLERLPAEINLSSLARRAGISPSTLHTKLKRWRKGQPDELTPQQAFALQVSAVQACREMLQLFDPTATIIVTQREIDHRIDLPATVPIGRILIGKQECNVIGIHMLRGRPVIRFQRVIDGQPQKPERLPIREFWEMILRG